MNDSTTPLRTLITVRRRQGERLTAHAKQARHAWSELQAQVHAAQAEQAACQADEAVAQEDLVQMMNRAFTPAALRALEFRINALRDAVASARQAVAQCLQAAQQQSQAVAAAQAAVRRTDQRIAGFQEHLDHVLRLRDEADQEREEDEMNEISSTRFMARQQALQETSHG